MGKKKAYLVLAAALVLVVVCAACSGASTEPESEPALIELAPALSNGQPTLAGFVTETCACQDVRPMLQELAVEYRGRLNVAVIEYPDERGIFAEYEVLMVPTLMFFDSSGEQVERNIGFLNREEIADRLDALGLV
jgi:thioredoxin 1